MSFWTHLTKLCFLPLKLNYRIHSAVTMAHPNSTPDNEAWNQPGLDFNHLALAAATGDLNFYDNTAVSDNDKLPLLNMIKICGDPVKTKHCISPLIFRQLSCANNDSSPHDLWKLESSVLALRFRGVFLALFFLLFFPPLFYFFMTHGQRSQGESGWTRSYYRCFSSSLCNRCK